MELAALNIRHNHLMEETGALRAFAETVPLPVWARSSNGVLSFANCCQPNALMTLKEYLSDYASDETRAVGEALIAREIAHVPNETIRARAISNLADIERGARDFRF